ncbi:MAG: SIR2 family protein [Proteobacteria bacterium]|nr:SIR2 family protein [Pseudomonadota bacterium]MBU4468926.1 SIR2 family protein [Pseudomonadota bacterium]MCG2750919.1 SIR2 family protein [Desulfobacteraceae bacterium]
MPRKTVFIFGAGASKAEGLPTQEELLKGYFSNNPQDNFSVALNGYFKDFFGIVNTMSTNNKWPTFEEALAMVEIAMDKEHSFGPVYTTNKLKEIRDGLIISMGRAIENCQTETETIHKKFLGKLFWKGHYCKDEYSFVSFNYDILLDAALMEMLRHDIYSDYGIQFANSKDHFDSSSFNKWKPPGDKSVLILKPHGSLNWMQCASCDAIAISGNAKGQIFKTGLLHTIERCPNDNSPMQFVIEPPSYFKRYKNFYLQTTWIKLNEALAAADKIVFIGYSMPDADVMIKYAFKRACFNQNKNILVVNPDETVKGRYERVLGQITFHKMGFADLLKSENYKKVIKD